MISPALLDEILEAADNPAQAQAMLDRLEARLDGIAAWPGPYRPDPAALAAGERLIREIRDAWSEPWLLYCSCVAPAEHNDTERCPRCGGAS